MSDALSFLYGLHRWGAGPAAPRVARYLERLGAPQRRFRTVQITGTNGKGSTAAALASMARAAGLRVGLFTSPHLRRFHERIQVNGVPIPEAALERAVDRLRPVVARSMARSKRDVLGAFEGFTLAAALYFAEQEIDLLVAEAGIGGALDATAPFAPCFGVLTSVGLDHTTVLGPTHGAIARQKVGAWRPGTPAVVGVGLPWLRRPLQAHLERRGIRALQYAVDVHARADGPEHFALRTPFGALEGLVQPLAGAHQRGNAALAASAAWWLGRRGWPIDEGAIRAGLAATRWPGRLDLRTADGVPVLLDAAHNDQAARTLAEALRAGPWLADGRPLHVLFGASSPHDPHGLMAPLRARARRWTLSRAQHRGLPTERLAAALAELGGAAGPVHTEPQVAEATRAALEAARAEGALLLVYGSIFVLDEVLGALPG